MKDFTDDTHVQKALFGLRVAMEAAAKANGTELHFVSIVAQDKTGVTPVLHFGCSCMYCRFIAIEAMAEAARGHIDGRDTYFGDSNGARH